MPFVRPDVANLLAMLAAAPGPKMEEGTPEAARMMMRAMRDDDRAPARRARRCPRPRRFPARRHAIPARLYSAVAAPAAGPVIVFFHGGGWVIGDLETHDPLCAEIARVLQLTVVSVDYRLAPEHRFPAATEDCLAAMRWLAATPQGGRPRHHRPDPGGRQRRRQPCRGRHPAAPRHAGGADRRPVADLSGRRHDRGDRVDARLRRGLSADQPRDAVVHRALYGRGARLPAPLRVAAPRRVARRAAAGDGLHLRPRSRSATRAGPMPPS